MGGTTGVGGGPGIWGGAQGLEGGSRIWGETPRVGGGHTRPPPDTYGNGTFIEAIQNLPTRLKATEGPQNHPSPPSSPPPTPPLQKKRGGGPRWEGGVRDEPPPRLFPPPPGLRTDTTHHTDVLNTMGLGRGGGGGYSQCSQCSQSRSQLPPRP